MAIRNVPPTGTYDSAGTATRRQPERSFAALYEQARKASVNDNPGGNTQSNQNTPNQNIRENVTETRLEKNEENRKYIEELHERVDTLRGELLVRVIQSGRAPREEATKLTTDISRLSNRLEQLRKKLDSEESRLSGKLVDVEI